MKTPTILYFDDNLGYAVIATDAPAAILAEIAECDAYPCALTPDGEYFIAKRFKVSFDCCDGGYSKNVTTPAAAAAKIREYIGEADADFGFVSDDGICRCTGVEVFHAGSKFGYRVPMSYLLNTFPSKALA